MFANRGTVTFDGVFESGVGKLSRGVTLPSACCCCWAPAASRAVSSCRNGMPDAMRPDPVSALSTPREDGHRRGLPDRKVEPDRSTPADRSVTCGRHRGADPGDLGLHRRAALRTTIKAGAGLVDGFVADG